MPWTAVAAGIGALGSLAGGLMSNASSRAASSDAISAQMAMNNLNYEAQKEFAQNGIRWRVADAKAAGLHPLAALGAAPQGFSPSFQSLPQFGGTDYSWVGDVGNQLGQMGQNIGRAVQAKATEKERAEVAAYESEARKLDLENKQLQNDRLRQQMIDNALASMQATRNQPGQPPAMQQVIPTGRDARILQGQGDAHTSNLFTVKPAEVVASDPATPAAEAGTHPEITYFRTADGGYAPMRSNQASQSLEDDSIGNIAYHVRNRLGSFNSNQEFAPPRSYLPSRGKNPDEFWIYDNLRGAWYPSRHSLPTHKKFLRAIGLH